MVVALVQPDLELDAAEEGRRRMEDEAVLAGRSAAEQGTEDHPDVLARLAELNEKYEGCFGFRFLVFVNRRPRSAIVPVLEERLGRPRSEELETALDELVAIARDRWESRAVA